MGLISTPFFRILLNGAPNRTFQPSRGIRQHDLLSPFIFILMAEGLSHLLQIQAENGEMRGLRLQDNMDPQTHQQFVNDTMLMGHPLVQEERSFKKFLSLFTKASGLAVNPAKSQVFFLNTTPATQRNILCILGFVKGSFPSKYLGVPLGLRKFK